MRDTFTNTERDAGLFERAYADDGHPTGEYCPQDDYPVAIECPCCGGPGIALGTLGQLEWHRCRDCGMDFEQHEAEVAADQDDAARAE
jgi:hypothetical protein